MKNIDAEIQQIYERMVPEIQKEIESFYQRYADKEGISLAEAKKRVSKFDVRAFEARAAKMVKERDFSDEANELMRLYNATMRINRLELLKADIGLHMIDGFDDLEKLTGEKLTEEAVKEFERQAGILGNGVKGASERAKSLVGQSFMNATFSERIWSNQEALRNKLSTILTKGLIGGKSYQSLVAEIRKDFSVSAREAMRLVRTEMVRVQTQAQIDSYKANGWEEFEFLAYGTASCEICNALNKKHFKISDFQPAENAPPMHPNCRCRTAPYEDEEEYQKWLDSFGDNRNYAKAIDKFIEPDITNLKDSVQFTKEDIIEELLLSPVGRDTIRAIEESNVIIKISEEKPFDGVRGYEKDGEIVLYPRNAKNRTVAGQTLIHEMAHFRFRIGGCQHAEAVCFAMEKMHIMNRDWLTEEEWRKMVDLAKFAYPELEWEVEGGGNFEQFNFVKKNIDDGNQKK